MDYDFYLFLIKFEKSSIDPTSISSLLKACFGYENTKLLNNHVIAAYIYKTQWIRGYRHLLRRLKNYCHPQWLRNWISVANYSKKMCSSSHCSKIRQSDIYQQFMHIKKVVSLCDSSHPHKNILLDDYLLKACSKRASLRQLLIVVFWKHLIIREDNRITDYKAEYHFQIDEHYQVKFASHPQAMSFNAGNFKVHGYDPHNLIRAFQTLVDRKNHCLIIFKHALNPASQSLMEMNSVKPDYKLQDVDAITINFKDKQVSTIQYKFPRDYLKVQNLFVKLMY